MSEYTVMYLMGDEVKEFTARGNMLREAVFGEGINQEYSCRVGQCCACTGRLVDASPEEVREFLNNGGDPGGVDEEFGYLESDSAVSQAARAFSDEELEDGYVLTCVASPREDVVLDMQEYPETI